MKIRYGIIGLGSIANRFAGVATSMDDVEITAVASRDQARSDEFAKKYGVKTAYDDYTKLMVDENVDIIYIALTHNFHFEVMKACIGHGKAILCEKPMVISEEEATEIFALAKDKKVLVMEAMWTRCLPAFQKAREWVKEGRIGKVNLVNASFAFNIPVWPEHRLYNPDLAGGSLYDAGVYPIEFAIGILDEAPSQTVGIAHICETGVDDFYSISMGFDSGALASLSCGFSSNTNRDGIIYGRDGHIIVYDFLGTKKCELYDKDGGIVETFEDEFEDGFIYEIRHAAELYKNEKIESPLIPHKDTIACSKVFDVLLRK